MKDTPHRTLPWRGAKPLALGTALLTSSAFLFAQSVQKSVADSAATPEEDEPIVLSPFTVDSSRDVGYQATSTLAGTRVRTDLADVGSSISVLTKEFLMDVHGVNNESTLAYAVNTEVGGARGNFSGGVNVTGQNTNELNLFANPNGNTRVRGLASADNTRNYFLADIPWDGYTVARVDLQRGPNAILFGLGSPAGVVNTTINSAEFFNRGEVQFSYDQFGTQRYTFDYNRELLKNELAVRVAVLHNDQKFRQEPAYNEDQRLFAALKYRPSFLNREGMTFEIAGNYEHGKIRSNRPRILTPLDQLSGWWLPQAQGGLDKRTFDFLNSRNVSDRNNAAYIPSLGGYRSASLITDVLAGTWGFTNPRKVGARKPDGTVFTSTTETGEGPFPQPSSYGRLTLRGLNEWATAANLPFADFGGYDPATLTDPSVFDFYNKLMDGPNKGEWSDWNVFDVSLTQTFFNEVLGYNIAAFKQTLNNGQYAALGWQNRIFIDLNEKNADGSANPNVGRAFTEEEMRDTNALGSSDRDAYRAQLFASHDFSKKNKGFWAKLLGEHRTTLSFSEENQERDERSVKSSQLDIPSMGYFSETPLVEGGNDGFSNAFRYYLSGDLRGRSSAVGANLNAMSMPFIQSKGGPVTLRYFDNTWTAPATVNPGAPWQSPDLADVNTDRLNQSNNPANYRGWTTRQGNMATFFSEGTFSGMNARDYLTTYAKLSKFEVESMTAVWQGYFWNKSLIGLYGYRKDKARSYIHETGGRAGDARADTGGADVDPSRYNYSNPRGDVRNLETITRNWSSVLHLNRLLGKRDFLPLNVSLYYNQGENFSPLAGRIDAFRKPLPPPAGETKEYSALLATKNGKYSARITKYETKITNATTSGSIGNMWALEQSIFMPANLMRDFRSGKVPWANYNSDPAKVTFLQTKVAPAWFQFEKDLKTKFPDYVSSWLGASTPWGTDSNNEVQAAAPAGFAYTEDSISKGYEFELTANPTDSWRLAVNASKTEASRTNVPGAAFKSVAEYVDTVFMTTDVGMAPIWWHQNDFGMRNFGPYPWNFRPDWLKLKSLNGQSTPEVRKWRANAITTYNFKDGRLKGVGVGGALRWEDKSVIDYAPMKNKDGSNGINLNAPFYAPSEKTFDLWLSYSRKISEGVRWRIQLNVYNVLGKNELVPVAASVDPVAIQKITTITPETVIPMRGSAFMIREGRSWTLTNTIEF